MRGTNWQGECRVVDMLMARLCCLRSEATRRTSLFRTNQWVPRVLESRALSRRVTNRRESFCVLPGRQQPSTTSTKRVCGGEAAHHKRNFSGSKVFCIWCAVLHCLPTCHHPHSSSVEVGTVEDRDHSTSSRSALLPRRLRRVLFLRL